MIANSWLVPFFLFRDTDESRNEGDQKMHVERGRDTLMRNVAVETDNKPTR